MIFKVIGYVIESEETIILSLLHIHELCQEYLKLLSAEMFTTVFVKVYGDFLSTNKGLECEGTGTALL